MFTDDSKQVLFVNADQNYITMYLPDMNENTCPNEYL